MISPAFSIGASVASLKCEVSGGVRCCRPAEQLLKSWYIGGADYPASDFSVLEQATMQIITQADLFLQTQWSSAQLNILI